MPTHEFAVHARQLIGLVLKLFQMLVLPGFVLAERIVMAERVGEKLQAFVAHLVRQLGVVVAHEAGDDRDIRD